VTLPVPTSESGEQPCGPCASSAGRHVARPVVSMPMPADSRTSRSVSAGGSGDPATASVKSKDIVVLEPRRSGLSPTWSLAVVVAGAAAPSKEVQIAAALDSTRIQILIRVAAGPQRGRSSRRSRGAVLTGLGCRHALVARTDTRQLLRRAARKHGGSRTQRGFGRRFHRSRCVWSLAWI